MSLAANARSAHKDIISTTRLTHANSAALLFLDALLAEETQPCQLSFADNAIWSIILMARVLRVFLAFQTTLSASVASIHQPALNAKWAITLTLYFNAKLALETVLYAQTTHSASLAAKAITPIHQQGIHV